MTHQPIIITGAGRSGASMIAGVLSICGAFGGNIDGENKLYENLAIRDQILIPYLNSLEVDIEGQYPLPHTSKITIPSNLASQVIEIMKKEGYKDGPWFMKGFRMSLTWPIWHYAFPNAKWLIVRRRTGDIITSCLKTDYMQAFKDPIKREMVGAKTEAEGWRWWVRQFERRFIEMITEGINCQVIWPERMVYGDYQQLFTLVDWLGLKWKTEALTFVDPKFWRVRKNNIDKHKVNISL